MNKDTADTALQIQRAADATTASLEILRQERAERGKEPSLALYVGNLPIDRQPFASQAAPNIRRSLLPSTFW